MELQQLHEQESQGVPAQFFTLPVLITGLGANDVPEVLLEGIPLKSKATS